MIVQMLKNKGVSQDTPFLCNQYENQVAEITVNLPEEYVDTAYFYYMICKSPNPAVAQFATPLLLETDAVTLLPLNKVKYIVGSNISWTAGNWEFCLLIKSVAMVNGAVGADGIVAVSEYFTGKIKSGIIDADALAEQPADPNIIIVYDTMIAAVAAESVRISNEEARQTAETTRLQDEITRNSNEVTRNNNETARVNTELARDTAEGLRNASEVLRNTAENERVASEAARSVCEVYNPLTAYVVGNKVTYLGSTYRNIVSCSGVVPTNTANWLLIAAKGADGEGAGDMLKSVYDTDNDGIVDDSKKLSGQLPAYYAKSEDLGDKSQLTTENKTNLVAALNEHETLINSLVPKADIIQTTEVNDSTKIPSSVVTYAMQQNLLNNYMAYKAIIPSAGDLNNYVSTGIYNCVGIGNEVNLPENAFGTLIVFSGAFTLQIYVAGNNNFYTRIFVGSVWTAWALK